MKDSECDSGACDLAAGACVDQSAILYASPGGTPADPCARLLPCSLDKAATSVDAGHPYIVLLPGVHVAGASFTGQNVTICGNDATIDTNVALLFVTGGSFVRIRDLKLIGKNLPDRSVIENQSSELALDNITLDLTSGGVYAISGGPKISIRNSTIIHGFTNVFGSITIDESTFLNSAIGILQTGEDLASITNSILVSSSGGELLGIEDPSDGSLIGGSLVANNTFVGGSISCGEGTTVSKSKHFESNIFLNITGLTAPPGCHYDFNLIVPTQNLGGTGNITGDPMFVDATSNDFHLRAGSPAIDAAAPTPRAPNTHDHDGRSRPQGKQADIGAFEYVP